MADTNRDLAKAAAEQLAADVEQCFRDRVPAAYFAAPRIVRRVVRGELELTKVAFRVPHRKGVVIDRDRLLWLVALDELGANPGETLPPYVLLVARPEEDRLIRFSRDDLLRYYWRLLFHLRIDRELFDGLSARTLTTARLRELIDEFGQTQFDEARAVLKQEGMLSRPNDLRHVVGEVIAVALELAYFAPDLLPIYFPSLERTGEVIDRLAQLVGANAIFEETRPVECGGVDPAVIPNQTEALAMSVASADSPGVSPLSPRKARGVLRRAEVLRRKGNAVRAAILLRNAAPRSPADERFEMDRLLTEALESLAGRLQAALRLDNSFAESGVALMRTVLEGIGSSYWSANARLLYDLQKVCIDSERESYRTDLLRWAFTLGRWPLKRPLPHQRVVLIQKHLRAAAARLPAARMAPETREQLDSLLHQALFAAETLLREQLRPILEDALPQSGLVPTSVVERVAFSKLIDELLDVIVNRGFLTFGDLRDSVSRNQLKLPDLSSLNEFVFGDNLLRADRRLSTVLDGIYRKGPFYLLTIQRLSSLAFGMPSGRFLTRHFLLPFGGAFVILEGLSHLVEPISDYSFGEPIHLYSNEAMIGLGCIIWAIMHFEQIRVRLYEGMFAAWKFLRGIAFDLPRALLQIPMVEQALKSLPMKLFRRHLLSPLILTFLLWILLPYEGGWLSRSTPWAAAGIFIIAFAALNSRLGRDTEELTWEWLGRAWYRFRVHILFGLFNWIVDTFRQIMDFIERVLYSVDEQLRFRTGESSLTLAVKSVLTFIWSIVQAVVRFCVTLLIEPQVNPIKHFPVVTVSHKLLVPLIVPFARQLAAAGMDHGLAFTSMTVVITCIPGLFGFLAWELKENWKLYAANRSTNLKPSQIGHHGETVLRMLRPGFHSGTIPKLFAKCRRAARKSRFTPEYNRQATYQERLHHEAEAIQHFAEREFVELLRRTRSLGEIPLAVAHVDLCTNRIGLKFHCERFPDDDLEVSFAEQSGWIVAGIDRPGWLSKLSNEQAQVFRAALAGFYALSAVDLVREQVESQFGTPAPAYDISEQGLVIWPDTSFQSEVHYSLREAPLSQPRPRPLARAANLEPLLLSQLAFFVHHIEWTEWREVWEDEQSTGQMTRRLLPRVQLLPISFAG